MLMALAVCLPIFLSAASAVARPEVSVQPTDAPLVYHKDLTVSEAEQVLGRKLSFWEKAGFRLQKKRIVKLINDFEQAPEPEAKGMNAMAIAGFVCSLVLAPLGIIFSAIALSQIKKTGEGGRGLATAGLVIGIAFTAIFLLF